MSDGQLVLNTENGSVIAPAGYGKTETIAKLAGSCRRALILTHTHAGVHAIRARLKKLEVPYRQAHVDTFAGWCMRYASAFKSTAQPPPLPPQGSEWDQLYNGTALALEVAAVRAVVEASYDRILIDEYQDCDASQHYVAIALSGIVPTTIFGDPMQGIFEFSGASLDWELEVFPSFPLVTELKTPYRWRNTNPSLGEWIGETREKLRNGESIDLGDERIQWRQSDNAFDMGLFFDDFDPDAEPVAAIHCRKGICYGLASATNGAFQAIEEIEAKTLREFAGQWDAADSGNYHNIIREFFSLCFKKKEASHDEVEEDHSAVETLMQQLRDQLKGANAAEAAGHLLHAARSHPRWKLFRSELWRDCERALAELSSGRCANLREAAETIRNRNNHIGRHLPRRTVSTPLLLKGLEFKDVKVPYAPHFLDENNAQAKLFYVAISRATQSLSIGAPERVLKLPPAFGTA